MKKTFKINLILFLFTALLLGSNFLIINNAFSFNDKCCYTYAEEQTEQTPTLPEIEIENELNYDEHYEQIVLFIIYTEEADPTSPDLETAERWLEIIEEKTQIEVNAQMQTVINRANLELPLYASSIALEDKTKVYNLYNDIDYLLVNRLGFVNDSYLLEDFNLIKTFVINCKNKVDKIEEDIAFVSDSMEQLDEKMPVIMTRKNFDTSEEEELLNLYFLSVKLSDNYFSYLTSDELARTYEYKNFLNEVLKTFKSVSTTNLKPLVIYIIGAVCFLSVGVFIILLLKNIPNSKYEITQTPLVKRRDLIGRYRLKSDINKENRK